MTAINLATDIPPGITTYEQLAIWVISALNNANAAVTAVEGQGYSEQAAQAGIFFVPASGKTRFLGRVSLEMDPNYLAGGQKPWKFGLDLSTTAINAAFKTN
jgi:hypothetical protein